MENKKFRQRLLCHLKGVNLNYKELQDFSSYFDKTLGFEIEKIENKLVKKAKELYPGGCSRSWGKSLYRGSQTWIGLDPDQLQTTYCEFYEAISVLEPKPREVFCDLGAGYGRLGILIGLLFEKINFVGLEIVKERVEEGARIYQQLDLENVKLYCEPLVAGKIAKADYYFIYDFGTVVEIDDVLNKLSKYVKYGTIKIIARGRGVRTLINNKHPWLSDIYQSFENSFVIYSSGPKCA